MHKLLSLTRVLLKNGSILSTTTTGKRGKVALLVFLVACVPLALMQSLGLWNTYGTIASGGMVGTVIAAELAAACVAMVLIGILYVISTFYFADDVVLLLTLPLRPRRVLAAKFIVVLLFQYLLDALIVLPMLVVIGIRNAGWWYWLNAVIVFVALPILPTVVCSVVSILLMAFSRFFRNKDRAKFLGGLVAILLALGISIPLQLSGGGPSMSSAMIHVGGSLGATIGVAFPSVLLASRSMVDGTGLSLLWQAAFLLLSALGIVLFLVVSDRLYLRGVVGLTQSAETQRDGGRVLVGKRHSALAALVIRDWRILYRTPTYSLNCLLGAFLGPVMITVLLAVTMRSVTIPDMGPLGVSVAVMAVVSVGTLNVVSSTAMSRDGRDAVMAHLLPVRPETQILAKLIPGTALSLASLLLMVVPASVILRPGLQTVAVVCVLGVVGVLSANMIGLLVDLAFPKLDWQDETVAVKQNINVFISLLLSLAVFGLPAAIIMLTHMRMAGGVIFLGVYDLGMLLLSALLLFRWGPALFFGIVGEPGNRGSVKARAKDGAAGMSSGASAGPRRGDWAIRGARRLVRLKFGRDGEGHSSRAGVAAAVVTAVALLACGGVLVWEFFFVRTTVDVGPTQVSVSAGIGEASRFDLSQVRSVYIGSSLPATSDRTGFESGSQLRGTFTVRGLGRGHVYAQSSKGPFLFIILKGGGFTVFNFEDGSRTLGLYHALLPYASERR